MNCKCCGEDVYYNQNINFKYYCQYSTNTTQGYDIKLSEIRKIDNTFCFCSECIFAFFKDIDSKDSRDLLTIFRFLYNYSFSLKEVSYADFIHQQRSNRIVSLSIEFPVALNSYCFYKTVDFNSYGEYISYLGKIKKVNFFARKKALRLISKGILKDLSVRVFVKILSYRAELLSSKKRGSFTFSCLSRMFNLPVSRIKKIMAEQNISLDYSDYNKLHYALS